MPMIDYSTPTGKLRMRLGDISDLPFLPDSVYTSVYAECNNNLNQAVVKCGMMILGQLAFRTRRKMAQLEVFGSDSFEQFKQFLLMTVKEPALMDISPIPYSATAEFSPILDFQRAWNSNFTNGSEAQQLSLNADISPNANTRTY